MSSGTEVTNVWCSLRFSRFISSGPTVLDSLRSLSSRTGARRERFFRMRFMCSR